MVRGLTVVCFAFSAAGATLHVKPTGDDNFSGANWEQAKRTVANALSAASAHDEVWIAAGRYQERVTLKPSVALYGGFAGHEIEREQRNWKANLSILDGNYGGLVVNMTDAGPSTRIDGLVITGGLGIHGGGVAMVASAPVLANNLITANITDGAGAGVSIWGFHIVSSAEIYQPLLTNNTIVANQSINDEGDGGGIAVVNSSPVIVRNVIARNTATRNGGGIACWRHSLPLIANNLIEANSASYDQGTASTGGGGIFASATDLDGRPISGAVSAPLVVNNVIAANGARSGGGVALIDSRLGAGTLQNNTIVANSGSGVFWGNTSPTNENNLVAFNAWGFERHAAFTNEAVLRFNNVFGNSVMGLAGDYHHVPPQTGQDGNISADPKLAHYRIGEFHLQPDSPCINAGSPAPPPTALPDIDGQPRVQGSAVDIGADESDGAVWSVATPIIYVSPNGSDGDGLTWASAKRTLKGGIDALASITAGGELWVAQGLYSERIELPAFVSLYGGFAGNETSREARRPAANPTIIDGSGVPRVVYIRNAGYRIAAVDGFILQNGGVFTGGNPLHPELAFRTNSTLGGAIYCRVSSPVIANNLIRTNSIGSPYTPANAQGAGIYGYLSHAVITGNTFLQNENLNEFDGAGGGIYSKESMMEIEGNVFRENHARIGSAAFATLSLFRFVRNLAESNSMYNSYPLPAYLGSQEGAVALSLVSDFLIEANTIRGHVASAGAGLSLQSCASGRVLNNLVVNNRAFDVSAGGGGMGGGLNCLVNLTSTNLLVANNVFVGNSAPAVFGNELGGAIAMTLVRSNLTLANNIIASNSSGIWNHPGSAYAPTLLNNCLNNSNRVDYLNLAPGPSDFRADPEFVSRELNDFHLRATSPCIDAGSPVEGAGFDFDGIGRPLDGDGDGAARLDVGAFEFVHPSADSDGDGMSDASEVVAGTNPSDADSLLRVTVRLDSAAERVVLSWPTVLGRTYRLEFRVELLESAAWQVLDENLRGTGEEAEILDPTATDRMRYYRIAVTQD